MYKILCFGKENWVLHNTPRGARASATIYSVIETAKANGLSVEKYLVYLMDVLSSLEDKDKNKDTLIKHMPWSKKLPMYVFLQNKDIHNSKS
ncbi:transposase domain-containing protein [Clostridium kluyveri]|uniref:transposase domain-containing protein n=1 Tax=Clostridium kluyveri TaxID=1534 RepID=UPI0018DB4409|nr:transposase domain-containing protein [Clostridium kluyveri]